MNQLKQFQRLSGLFKVAGGVGAVGYLGYNSLFTGECFCNTKFLEISHRLLYLYESGWW